MRLYVDFMHINTNTPSARPALAGAHLAIAIRRCTSFSHVRRHRAPDNRDYQSLGAVYRTDRSADRFCSSARRAAARAGECACAFRNVCLPIYEITHQLIMGPQSGGNMRARTRARLARAQHNRAMSDGALKKIISDTNTHTHTQLLPKLVTFLLYAQQAG